jgi:hypothetical protein
MRFREMTACTEHGQALIVLEDMSEHGRDRDHHQQMSAGG